MFSLKNNPVLTPHQVKILKVFFVSPLGKQFFLTGETALAGFYLAHRKSEDLDLFTLKIFDTLRLIKVIEKILKETSSTIKKQIKTEQYWEIHLESRKKDWIQRLDFVQEQPVIFGKRRRIDDIIVDNLENIATNKILTIYGRLEPKDYLDLYFIVKETKFDFLDLFKKAKKKDTGLHEFYFANIVTGVSKIKMFPETLKPFDREKLVGFYLDLSEKMLRSLKPKK